MPVDRSRPYAIHSAGECDMLERQAILAGIEDHLHFVPVQPGAQILDAGCGSGSMARLFASRHPDCQVTGIDLRADYLTYARERAAREDLHNLDFREGDVFRLPFPDATFEVVWSKYVLQWVKTPQAAVAEFARVAKPGGLVVCCNYDGFGVTHWPEDQRLQPLVERVFPELVDPFIGRKLAPVFHATGLVNIKVAIESDRLFTVIGSIGPERRQNWVEQWTAGRPYVAGILGSEVATDQLAAAFLAYQDRADSSSYTALYFVRGRRPGITWVLQHRARKKATRAQELARKAIPYLPGTSLLIYLNISDYGVNHDAIKDEFAASVQVATSWCPTIWILWKGVSYPVFDRAEASIQA